MTAADVSHCVRDGDSVSKSITIFWLIYVPYTCMATDVHSDELQKIINSLDGMLHICKITLLYNI